MCVLENVHKTEQKADKCASVRNVQCDHLLKSGHLPSGRVRLGTEKDRLKDWQVHSDIELNTFWTTMHSSHLFEYGMKQRNR